MASIATTNGILRRGTRVCQQCLTRRAVEGILPQRRSLKTKFGLKYEAKVQAAEKSWAEKALKIKEGLAPSLWDVFEERGYIKDVVGNREDIKELMRQKRIGAYVGIDPTADSLHVGHLLPLMPLFWMYYHGFGAITIIGGATAKIGDPTGRLESRKPVESSELTMNFVKIHYQLKQIWTNVEARAHHFGYQWDWGWRRAVVHNGHWWNKLPLLEVLRRLGNFIRIGPMLSRDTVKNKMQKGDGMSFAEFSYPLMQAWDWWRMYESRGVQMQIGGSDQYGNIVMGADAVRSIRNSEPQPSKRLPDGELNEVCGFTVPLLTDSSGAKFGKSAGNAIWLDQYKTSLYEQYRYFLRQPDDEVERLLKLFTFISTAEIRDIMQKQNENPPERVAQHTLAFEILALVHGEKVAKETRREHQAWHGKSSSELPSASNGQSDEYVSIEGHPTTPNNAPRVDMILPHSLIWEGKVGKILHAAGLADSISNGHKLASAGGAYIGASPGQKSAVNKGMGEYNIDFTPIKLWFPQDTQNFVIDEKYIILRKGKHNIRVIEIVSDEVYAASGQQYRGQHLTGKKRKLMDEIKLAQEEVEISGEKDESLKFAMDAELATQHEDASDDMLQPEKDQTETEQDDKITFPAHKTTRILKLEGQLKELKEMLRLKSGLKDMETRSKTKDMKVSRRPQGRLTMPPKKNQQPWMTRGHVKTKILPARRAEKPSF